MDEYNETWMIVGTWWTQADMAESWWRSGGLHAQRDCGPYTHHDHLRPVHDAVSVAAVAGQDTPATAGTGVVRKRHTDRGTDRDFHHHHHHTTTASCGTSEDKLVVTREACR